MRTALTILLLAVLAAASPVTAKNIDLVTLPQRDTVQLTIYNSEDLTLVKETRSLTLKKGANKLQFSWANTLIDPTSITFRPLEQADKVELIDTVFPGQKPQHLIWNVDSKIDGQVKVEVTYFTSGLSWSMDYVGITDPEETKMYFRGYVRVFNNSGEEYENAQVRLIVGNINLVEKIVDLARRKGIPAPPGGWTEDKDLYGGLKLDALNGAFARAGDMADRKSQSKEIVKEGLSEYFMFSVSGTEDIPNGWSKRMQAVEAKDVPFDIVYRMRAYQYGPRPVRFFTWRNDAEHKLGDSPLPDGRVNLFRDNGQDGLAFLGREQIRYVPVKAEIEINLGPDDLVTYETIRMETQRLNFHFARPARNDIERVDGWDERTRWEDTIRNYRTKPITFELRRQWDGDVDYESDSPSTLFDYRTVETKFSIPARGKIKPSAAVTIHMGVNRKQDRVNLKAQP